VRIGIKEAEDLLNEAYNFHIRARGLLEKGDYSGSIQAVQSCIELSIKSLYKLVDLSYPHSHDPAKEINKVLNKLRFPEHSLYKNYITRLVWISKMSAVFHIAAVYGCLDVGASKLFRREDVEFLLNYSFETWDTCNRIQGDVRNKYIKI